MSDPQTAQPCSLPLRSYGYVLLVLLILFSGRVLAQLIQAWVPVRFLPPFDAWHSGVLPYPALVLIQLIIIGLCLGAVWNVLAGSVVLSPRKGRILLALGLVYFGVMALRLVVGVFLVPDHFWFGARLPTLFHLVLAAFVLLYGRLHSACRRERTERSREGVL